MGLVVIVTLILAVVVKMIAVIRLYKPTNTAYVCSCIMAGNVLWCVCACFFVEGRGYSFVKHMHSRWR